MIFHAPQKTECANKRIGLLGGSFNPAHKGHLAISEEALKCFKLDSVWWLVSPSNPLKDPSELAPLDVRMKQAQKLATNPRILVTDLEQKHDLNYTFKTLEYLKRTFPDSKFIWLMGTDCLLEFSKWKHWEKIIEMVPFAIFARPGYPINAFAGIVADKWNKNRLPEKIGAQLTEKKPPAWVYIKGPLVNVSATKLRRQSQATQPTDKKRKERTFDRK